MATKKSTSSKTTPRKSPAKKTASPKTKAAKKPAAKKTARKYSPATSDEVGKEMHDYKRGQAKSGPGGKGGKVKSRKQAIAIGLSKARAKGKKVPAKKS